MSEVRDSVSKLFVRLALGVAVLAAADAWAAEVLARLDRTQVVEGETVTLVVQTDDPAQSLEADFSLLEQDFLLLDRRSETQMSIVNGRQAAVVRLLLTLEPKRAGELRVPALQFPGARTEPLLLSVEPAPELAPGEAPPVFIELSLEPADGPYYVHAQLSLTVKIFYQQNLTEASINPPAPEQASVRLLDEVPFPAERNGTRYRVLQRRYAIFPERSGTLVIPPMRLTGRLIERSGERLWQPSVRGRRVAEESEPLVIEILPRPAVYAGDHWLPARQLTLSQQLSETTGVRVGEPVTRTVILDAVGLEDNMLEEPAWPEVPDARIYPDQPQGISRDDGQWVRGHKEFRYAVVPEQPGELLLPELRLEWWDTVSNEARTAVLPALRVPVEAVPLPPEALVTPRPGAPAIGASVDGVAPVGGQVARLWRNAAIALAVLWLLTLALLFRRRTPRERAKAGRPGVPGEEAGLLGEMKEACNSSDPARTRMLLRHWLRQFGPAAAQGSIVCFASLADDPELGRTLREFEACGYREGNGGVWNGRELWQAFSGWRKRRDSGAGTGEGDAADLYARAR